MRRLALAALLLAATASSALAAPRVVASIMPIHSLVAGVMQGVGEPELLLSGQNSEHTAALTPRQLESLIAADLVFMVGAGLETKLVQLDGAEAVGGRHFTALATAPGVTTLPIRAGGTWEAHRHDHGHEHDDHEHETENAAEDHSETEPDHGIMAAFDPHVWLDPANAKAMVAAIAHDLAAADPAHAATYTANAAAMESQLDGLKTSLAARLSPVKGQPFIVFHDAYHYFEHAFDLSGVGSISDVSAAPPSAKRLKEIQDKIRTTHAVCIFREPQFPESAVAAISADTGIKTGVLDPIGATLSPGPQAYTALLNGLADNLAACLGP
jgi:zinc transport system substrate-binding protein